MDRPPHALVVGMPQSGHWDPIKTFFLQLAREKVSLSVLCTREMLAELEGLKKEGVFEGLSHVQFWEVFNDTGKNHPFVMAAEFGTEFLDSSVKEKLISQISSGYGPTFLVADMFMYWTQDLADELGIPGYVFFTSPTSMALVALHTAALLREKEKLRSNSEESCQHLGFEVCRYRDIPKNVYLYPEFFSNLSQSFLRAAGHLINSFEPLETADTAALRSGLERVTGVAKAPKVYLIGPLSYFPPFPVPLRQKELAPKADDSAWFNFLNTQSANSVLYICFGSRGELDEASINDLARALELTDVPFLWARPRPKYTGKEDVDYSLPTGFTSRTHGKGLVLSSWAPQEEILAHSSVGGFISHCGWNSCVEAIHEAVPLICWPLGNDQFMNARLLSQVAKVGIQLDIKSNGDAKMNEVAEAIQALMKSEEGKKYRMKMQELQKSELTSVKEGGSSVKAFQEFVQDVSTNSLT